MEQCKVCKTSWFWGKDCPTCKKDVNLNDTYNQLRRVKKVEKDLDVCEDNLNRLEKRLKNL